jgi:uncharacterized membrane protein
MKRAILAFAALALLAGCAGSETPGGMVLTRQSQESDDWGRHLPKLYGGIMVCLAAHPDQPAFATHVTPQNHGMILVRMRGADRSLYECSTDSAGSTTPVLKGTTRQRVAGPAFTPATMAEPYMRCGSPQPVLSGTGRLIGWLTYFTPDCPPRAGAAETGWRAFGNEPYWSLRIAGEDVVFDRLGSVPQRYGARAPAADGNRLTWALEPPEGGAGRDRLEVVITETACGDTMATRQYPYSAEVMFQGRRYRGCAEKTAAIP